MDLAHQLRCLLESVEQPSIEKMQKAILATGCTLKGVAPYIREPKGQLKYGRNVILRLPKFEGIVINLPAGIATPIHDHGGSIGCVYVVSGAFINRLYRVEKYSAKLSSHRRVGERESLFIQPKVVHSMYNPGKERMISLHVYSPPLNGSCIYPSSKTSQKNIVEDRR